MHIISMGFVFSAVSVTYCGVLEALGKGISSFVISLLRYVVIIIPAAYLFSRLIGAKGVFYAFPVAEILTAGITIYAQKIMEKSILK